jgi:hypothetical protein
MCGLLLTYEGCSPTAARTRHCWCGVGGVVSEGEEMGSVGESEPHCVGGWQLLGALAERGGPPLLALSLSLFLSLSLSLSHSSPLCLSLSLSFFLSPTPLLSSLSLSLSLSVSLSLSPLSLSAFLAFCQGPWCHGRCCGRGLRVSLRVWCKLARALNRHCLVVRAAREKKLICTTGHKPCP